MDTIINSGFLQPANEYPITFNSLFSGLSLPSFIFGVAL